MLVMSVAATGFFVFYWYFGLEGKALNNLDKVLLLKTIFTVLLILMDCASVGIFTKAKNLLLRLAVGWRSYCFSDV